MVRISDLRAREVINVVNGKRLGLIKDIEVDLEKGKIKALVLPGGTRLWGFLGRSDDVYVPWSNIKKIGIDVLLVEINGVGEINLAFDEEDEERDLEIEEE